MIFNRIKRMTAILFVFVLSLNMISCSSNIAKATANDKEVVMKINDFKVRRDLYNYFYENYKNQYDFTDEKLKLLSEEERSEAEKKLKDSTEESLKNFYAIYTLSETYGLSSDDELIKNSVDDYIETLKNTEYDGSEKLLRKDIESQHMTYDVFLLISEANELQSNLYLKLISEKVIEQDPNKLKDIFLSGEMVRTKHILIKYPEQLTANDIINDFKDAAESVSDIVNEIENALKNEEDFDKLIDRYNSDPLMIKNPDGNYITKGNKYLEYEKAAYELEIGETSDVFYTSEGACIIMRLPLSEEYIDNNITSLTNSYGEGYFNTLLENEAQKLIITY